MGKPTGFLEHRRTLPERRPIPLRVRDWREIYEQPSGDVTRAQGARCMDCGVPFCHDACPLGNLIPEWNHLVYTGDWQDASERLHATNNFPEMTGRLCPAPCEAACVLGIGTDPVTIERIEQEIAERAWREGWVTAQPASVRSGKRVAVVGSGPAGLACAQQLARAGHAVTVYERAGKPGGLLRYGIPEFKMEKHVLDRRLAQLTAEGVELVCGVSVGDGSPAGNDPEDATIVAAADLLGRHDAMVLACGAGVARDLPVPGRELDGVHFALEYLKLANLVQEGAIAASTLDAAGRHVVIVGGGDTGADCLGTAHRQGAASVVQLEILPEPPRSRAPEHPWPTWPVVLRLSAAHEEGGSRMYSVTPTALLGDLAGRVRAMCVERVAPSERAGGAEREAGGIAPVEERRFDNAAFEIPCDLVLLAMGFSGAEPSGVVGELGLSLDARGSVAVDDAWMTGTDGVFACGDVARGQSLIVWAIAEGRSAAASVDRWLTGTTSLPAPLVPGQAAAR